MTALAMAFISAGLFFLAVTTIGILRFPEFFSRTHVVSKSETLGLMLVIVGILVETRLGDGSYKLVLLVAFAMVANSTAMHGLARAVHRQRDADHHLTSSADTAAAPPAAHGSLEEERAARTVRGERPQRSARPGRGTREESDELDLGHERRGRSGEDES